MLAHITGLLLTILTALATIWAGPVDKENAPPKIAQSVFVLLTLFINPKNMAAAKNYILTGLAVAGLVVTFVATKLPAGSAALGLIPMVLGVITNLRTALNLPALPVDNSTTPQIVRDKTSGFIQSKTAVFVGFVAFLVGLGMLLHYSPKAKAADMTPQLGACITPSLCVQPAVAVSAFQLNLKTLDYEQIALAAGYGITYRTETVNFGAAIYGGVGLSKSAPNAPQVSILFNVADVAAFGPGVQTFTGSNGERIWQGLLTVALNLNVGATPTYLEKAVKAERLRISAEGGAR